MARKMKGTIESHILRVLHAAAKLRSSKIGPENWSLELEQGNHCGRVTGVARAQTYTAVGLRENRRGQV